jgi:hypothetical protein
LTIPTSPFSPFGESRGVEPLLAGDSKGVSPLVFIIRKEKRSKNQAKVIRISVTNLSELAQTIKGDYELIAFSMKHTVKGRWANSLVDVSAKPSPLYQFFRIVCLLMIAMEIFVPPSVLMYSKTNSISLLPYPRWRYLGRTASLSM